MPQGLRLASGAYRSYARQSSTVYRSVGWANNSQLTTRAHLSPMGKGSVGFRVGGLPLIDTQSSQLCFEPQKLLGQKS